MYVPPPRVRSSLAGCLFCLCLLTPRATEADTPTTARAEAFEVGAADVAELPRGKEADGIRGDFVLRNRFVVATIAGSQPGRKANMSVNWSAETPGLLYDLTLRDEQNDQLTCFAPASLSGSISSIRAETTSDARRAAVVAHRSAALGDGREWTLRYSLHTDSPLLSIELTCVNHTDKPWKLEPSPRVVGLRDVQEHDGIRWGDSQNPPDRQGYAWCGDDAKTTVEPSRARRFRWQVAVATSPAAAYGALLERDKGGVVEARIQSDGNAVASARLLVHLSEKKNIPAYPNADGSLSIYLPPGRYPYDVHDQGRPKHSGQVEVTAGGRAQLDVELDRAGGIQFYVVDESPGSRAVVPCKVQIIGIGGTASPHLGVDINARGCRNQYHSETGEFRVPLAPGFYQLIATRGIEFSHAQTKLEVGDGYTAVILKLRRVVDTRGWVSTDFHNHSTPSGDNYCGTDDRVINLAAEHIEFAPTTEHNRLYDWKPHIERLGLREELATVVGIELTGPGAHFNAFPMKVVPWTQDNGAPQWHPDARISAILLREFQGGSPDRYVQINHPQVGEFFRDRNKDGRADGGFLGLEDLIDAAEVWSTEILNPEPWLLRKDNEGKDVWRENRTFAWLQMLNQGSRMVCVAVSDAHSVFGNGVGGWRSYVPSSTDEPAKIDAKEIIRNAQAGRVVVTNGPFLEAALSDGTLPGGFTSARGEVRLHVKVQCTTWIDIDRVQILRNGRADESLNFTRTSHPDFFTDGIVKFDQHVAVPLTEDSHLIVVAWGEGHDLKTGYGESWQSEMHPCAFTNPMYIDVDGGGFDANGDTLGHPLVVGKRVEILVPKTTK